MSIALWGVVSMLLAAPAPAPTPRDSAAMKTELIRVDKEAYGSWKGVVGVGTPSPALRRPRACCARVILSEAKDPRLDHHSP